MKRGNDAVLDWPEKPRRRTRRVGRQVRPGVFFFALTIVALVTVPVLAPPASAHPHAWIDLRSTVLLDQRGRIIGIEQEWPFDDFYTLFVIEGANQSGVDQKTALAEVTKTNLENLRAFNYFTEARLDDRNLNFNNVEEYESELRGGRLWMRFVVPLSSAVDASAARFSFAVYDPTYYVEILHLKGDIVAFRGSSASQCYGQIVSPKPTTEAFLLAQAVDQDMNPDNTLGRIFAEQVFVSCRR